MHFAYLPTSLNDLIVGSHIILQTTQFTLNYFPAEHNIFVKFLQMPI